MTTIKVNTLLHKKDDFVGVVTDATLTHVYVAYYKWLPYNQPDNAISGMSGWYRVEDMLPYVTTTEDRIFKEYGLPPEYEKQDRRAEIESELRKLVFDWQRAEGIEDEGEIAWERLVDYVMELLDNA